MFVNFFFFYQSVSLRYIINTSSRIRKTIKISLLSLFSSKSGKKKKRKRVLKRGGKTGARGFAYFTRVYESPRLEEREKLLSSATGGQIFWSGFFYRWRTQARGNAVVAAGEKL